MSDDLEQPHAHPAVPTETTASNPAAAIELEAPQGSADVRTLESVINDINYVFGKDGYEGCIGFAVQMRTPKGHTVQLHWGRLKVKELSR